jgi:transposase InsO family protein
MKRETLAGAATVKLLCATFSVSRQAYYEAKRLRTTTETAAKVVRLPRRPGVASAETILEKARLIIGEHRAWGVRKVWATLRREHSLKVSKKRVWAIMKANGLVLARDSEPGEPCRGHVAVPEPGRRLATDLTTTHTKKDGTVAISLAIDCGCRSILGLLVSVAQDARTVLAPVEEALQRTFDDFRYIPMELELRTDHGPQYTGADCKELVDRWKIDHTFAPVGRPTGNAVAERFIRTMKEEVIWLKDWESAAELQEALQAWLVVYHTRRAHQALGWLTPAEYRERHLGTKFAIAA